MAVLTIGSASLMMVYLFLQHDTIPSSLLTLLSNPTITKIGYNVHGDATRIKNSWDISIAPLVDVMVPKCPIEVAVHLRLKMKMIKPFDIRYGT